MAAEDRPLSNLPELVPAAAFMEDVNAYMQGKKAEEAISELRDSHQKYKYIEAEIVQRKRRLAFKQPEIQKCLAAVNLLLHRQEAGEPTVLDFSLSDQVYARARVADVTAVNLWLGAGVMLEYTLEDARALLERQLAGCREQLQVVQWEHEYIKDQLTTTEVSMARVYNWDVQHRRTAGTAVVTASRLQPSALSQQHSGTLGGRRSPGPLGAPPIRSVAKIRVFKAMLSFAGQASLLACNTLSGAWPNMSPVATLAIKPLDISLQATPATLPTLPLLSPSATPFPGTGFGSLVGCGVGQSLEQVMSVATDPMSRHFIHLNTVVVDMDHDTMDALMEVEAEEAGAAQRGLPQYASAAAITAAHFARWGPVPGALSTPEGRQGQHSAQQRGAAAPAPLPARPSSACSAATAAATAPSSTRRSPSQQHSASTQAPLARAVAHREAAGADGGEANQHSLSVPFLDENGYFDMTLKDAAEQLGVGVTTLKKLCRQSGLGRWPYRARCSLRNLRDKMREYFACAPVEEREAADALMEREFCRLARMNVGAIDDAFKQFRQAMFKLEFKARQQLEAGRGGGGASGSRKRPHAAAAPPEGELNAVFHGDAAFRQQAMLHLRRLLATCSDGSH